MSYQPNPVPNQEESNRTIVLVAYVLGAVGIFTAFIPILIALIICYVKRGEATGTIYYSHYDWLISTFWIGMFWFVVAMVTMVFGVGFIVYGVLSVWLLYRFVKGLLRFSERKAVV
ncbi:MULTISPECIES: hypothetical protein [unclassified Limnobacter]|uniref:DUF4870 family protein n=1 Tax=unclassified Limnobacter TaxID=2630203 RepID=UPI000C36CCBE|nr:MULTISPECIES: hypothetical protein [unclassified Limnobacter]MAZ10234.1 hypothetical protein [Sutterellaceae bacterium]|tara:strand:- start:1340 stop:1687 length:348 start_codon:yes stop_codon:yes gene_type:complete